MIVAGIGIVGFVLCLAANVLYSFRSTPFLVLISLSTLFFGTGMVIISTVPLEVLVLDSAAHDHPSLQYASFVMTFLVVIVMSNFAPYSAAFLLVLSTRMLFMSRQQSPDQQMGQQSSDQQMQGNS